MSGIYTSAKSKGRPSKLAKPKPEERLVIVGNGMVCHHFCKNLIKQKLHETYKILIIGAETLPAYDRIHLSTYIEAPSAEALLLSPEHWYNENNISLILDEKIISIDSTEKTITSDKGGKYNYDKLVLATGSRCYTPPIDGLDHEKVILYRTIDDVEKIVQVCKGSQHGTIIGGGLLGLEAAQALQSLNVDATVIQRSRHLMPAQLTPKAAELLKKQVSDQGINILTDKNTENIFSAGDRVLLNFSDGESLETDFVIISAGITPNSEYAQESGITCGIRGGIVVNNHLETSEKDIFAIGECALFEGQTFGLAAPGYAMAEHLALRLSGKKLSPMPKPDMSTKLKMVGIEVTNIGDSLSEGVTVEFENDTAYRAVTLTPKGEILGGMGVGEWPEANKILSLYLEEAVLKEKERESFQKDGVLHKGGGTSSVVHWEDSRIVCNCMGIKKGEIIACFKTCGRDPDAIATETSCSEVCGSCRPLLEELCGVEPVSLEKPKGVKALMISSIIAILAIAAILIAPPAPIADSVESWYYKVDTLWRSNVTKQITGYSILLIFLLGLLISLRKRFKWFRFGQFSQWRAFHAIFGVVSLIALFAHTGFHFGDNLNYWLMLTFVLLNLLGGAAGVFSALESSGTSKTAMFARKYRPAILYSHLILFWPLPILLGFHIASVYLY